MPWYKDPTTVGLIGTLVGALISGAISLFIWWKTRKVKRLTCVIENPSSLLSVSDAIKDRLEVKFDRQPVDSAYLFNAEFVNTGNTAIEDQPIQIRLASGATIVDYKTLTEPAIGFGTIEEQKKEDHCLDLSVKLLNPRDRIAVEILSVGNPSEEIDIGLKNKDVETRKYTQKSVESMLDNLSSSTGMVTLAGLSVMPFIGSLARTLITLQLANKIERSGKDSSRKNTS